MARTADVGRRARLRLGLVRVAGAASVVALAALALHLAGAAGSEPAGWHPLLLVPALAAGLATLLAAPPTARPSGEVRPDADPDGSMRALLDLPPASPWAELLRSRLGSARPRFRPVGEWAPALVLLAATGVGALAVSSPDRDPGPPAPPTTTSTGASPGAAPPPARVVRPQPPPPELRGDGEDGAGAGAGREWPDARGPLAPGAPADEAAAVERYHRWRASRPEAEATPQ